ncbi:MAG: insulinase family protein, partial [Deltaproteobacteria bacterium]|nr:insulinase family protein [Deltaproteobacteria bacterium]
ALELAVASLADLVESPLLRASDLLKERMVIAEEIAQYEDAPEDFVQELLRQAAWGEHPLAHCELGSLESVDAIQVRHLRSFCAQHYRLPQMVLAVGGQSNPELVARTAASISWPSGGQGGGQEGGRTGRDGQRARRQPVPGPVRLCLLDEQDTEETHIALAVPALPLGHPEVPALMLLNDLLGGCMTSRLFQEVREKRGLAYDIESELDLLSDAGLWTVYTGVRPERAAQALRVIGRELGQVAQGKFTQDELDHARGHLLGASMLYLEHHRNLVEWQARHLLLQGAVPDIEARRRRLQEVSLAEARELAARLLDPQRLILTVVGPQTSIDPLRRALLSCW